jgi:glutaminyl-peptide cyclotransferase
VREAGTPGNRDYRAPKERIDARSTFGVVWLFSLFFFVSSCKPGNTPGSASSEQTPTDSNQAHPSISAALPPRREKIWTNFDGTQALAEARTLADFGIRPSGSDANKQVRQHLIDRLSKLGWQITEQRFTDHASEHKAIEFCNIIARFTQFPALPKKILIGAHFDTPDVREFRDVGASDGAANTAILLEIARVLTLDPRLAGQIELLFLDGDAPFQELNLNDGLFGSRFYVQMLGINQHSGDISAAILLGNVGSARLNFAPNSDFKLTTSLRGAAGLLGIRLEAANRSLLADHVPFAQAGIPSVTLLDAEAPFLHTADDTPERLDADSLAKTGQLILYFAASTTPAQ